MMQTETLDRLKELWRKRDGLELELSRSLALKGLWPTVFDHGGASSTFTGNLHRPIDMFFTVKDGKGTRRHYSLDECPSELFWPFASRQENPPSAFKDYCKRRRQSEKESG